MTTQSSRVADLRYAAVTHHLMSDVWAWRQRLVERLELGLGDHVRVTSAYQIAIDDDLIGPFVDAPPDHVRLWLPISSRPKQPLLNFDLRGPQGSAHLLRRMQIAGLQAGYLVALVGNTERPDLLASHWPEPVLRAICEFTPDVFHSFEIEHGRPTTWWPQTDATRAYQAYLSEGLGMDLRLDDVIDWLNMQEVAGEALVEALGEPPDTYSSSERPLLALPRLVQQVESPADVTSILERYVEGIVVARDAGETELLAVLADFGRRWQVIIDAVVPLGDPCSVVLSDNRPLQPSPHDRRPWAMNRLEHDAILVDARSSHLEVEVSDHRVEILNYNVHRPDGSVIGLSHWEGVRHTREFLSLYSAEVDRAPLGRLEVRLAPVPNVRWPTRLILALTLAAAGAALVVDMPVTETLMAFTLLTFPTTFAVALLLLREGTALAARMQWRVRATIILATSILWTVVLARLIVAMSGLVT